MAKGELADWWIDEYLAELAARRRTANTLVQYGSILQSLAEWKGDRPWSSLSVEDLGRWLRRPRRRRVGPATVVRERKVASLFVGFLLKLGCEGRPQPVQDSYVPALLNNQSGVHRSETAPSTVSGT